MRRPNRAQRIVAPKVLIVCEGQVTECLYFDGVRKMRRIQKERVIIRPACGDPKGVVDTAVKLKLENDALNKSLRLDATDMVWAVFDRDDHLKIPEAIEKAENNGVNIAFSNPNFELFLLLHFEDLTRAEGRAKVKSLLKRHIPEYDKHFDFERLGMHDKYPDAKRRIRVINSRSIVVAGIQEPPYCCVDCLIDHLKSF